MRFFLMVIGLLFSASTLATPPANTQQAAQPKESLFSSEGYRIARYKSPTPDEHPSAQRVITDDILTLLKQTPSPLLIDVKPRKWQQGIFLPDKPREQLPNSVWLPNVGKGELTPQWRDYFQHYLSLLTQGRQDYPIVLYCDADCWMSWNAAKRAASWGYTRLYWYQNGVDGWKEADLPTQPVQPADMITQQ